MAITFTPGTGEYYGRWGRHTVVRTSGGIPYVIFYYVDIVDGSARVPKVKIFKGNATSPTSFTEQDSANAPISDDRRSNGYSAVIDSNDVIWVSLVAGKAKQP